MPYREENYLPGHTPKAYPTVNPDKPIHVVTIGLDFGTDEANLVGYLIKQDRALEWYTNVGPGDGWRYGVRAQVEGIIADALDRDLDAWGAWEAVMATAPIALVAHEDRPERFFDMIKTRWSKID